MVGGSGCGKTNLLLNLTYDLLPWSRLYVYAKDLNEEKYTQLREACEKVKQTDDVFHLTLDNTDIVNCDELDTTFGVEQLLSETSRLSKPSNYWLTGQATTFRAKQT